MLEGNMTLGLVPLLPLIGAAVVFTITNKSEKTHALSGWLATAFSLSSFVCAVLLWCSLGEAKEGVPFFGWTWFSVAGLNAELAFRLDNLAAVMTLVITGVGSLIHLYAIGYMADDEHRPRFFCYLNLFLFAMLLLVLGDNLLVMFVGWEGVGLCSYLLIGFWFKEMENAEAGQKAFVVNRIGDAGFILGIFTLFAATGTINFSELSGAVANIPPGVIELAAILLFIGAVGKSAQVPLYVWLPDAMAGPTPVSALIHAATMVTAGVYMVTRMAFLFALAPKALLVISVVGTVTALLAATIALVQNDIKKVLAYSTVSQLGYMFMALGAGAFSNGIYHVVTHAFFKACLFMAAGSVIIGCHHEQDMREFGGLRKKMPFTFISYFIATLAIAGVPPLSGFYSKDAILWTVYSNTGLPSQLMLFGLPLNQVLWGVGLFTAFLTAFYMTRSLVLTFFGEYRGHEHPHESPWVVYLPLLILAGLSAVFGIVWGEQLMSYLGAWTRLDMLAGHEALLENPVYHALEVLSIVVAGAGIVLAVVLCRVVSHLREKLVNAFPRLYKALMGKWFVDELYGLTIVRPLSRASSFFFKAIDRAIIDAAVNGASIIVQASGQAFRMMHTGRVGAYAFMMYLFSFLLIAFLMVL